MQLGARWQSTLEYREDVPQFRVGPMMKTTRIADQGRTPSRKFPLQPPQPSRIDFLTPGGASRSSHCYSRFDHFAKRQLASKAPPWGSNGRWSQTKPLQSLLLLPTPSD